MNIDAELSKLQEVLSQGNDTYILDKLDTLVGEENPRDRIVVWCNDRALGFLAEGLSGRAELFFLKAIAYRPDLPDLYFNLANLYKKQGDSARAVKFYAQAVTIAPSHYQALFNLAHTHLTLNQIGQAEHCYNQILQYHPQSIETFQKLGLLYFDQQQYGAALDCFDHILTLDPANHDARWNLALVLSDLGRLEDAARVYRELTSVLHDDPILRSALAAVYLKQGKSHLALQLYREVVEQWGEYAPAIRQKLLSYLLMILLYCPKLTPEDVYAEHQQLAKSFTLIYGNSSDYPRGKNEPLRIGYVSGDFYGHPVATFLEPILSHHEHARFHITCYSNNKYDDSTTCRLQSFADQWRPIRTLDDEAAAALIRKDQIDVLFDLSGYTEGNRMSLFASRLASIQITYLGYPATTGLATMDYRLTDALADPLGHTESWHTEQLIRLPQCAWCYCPPPIEVVIRNTNPIRDSITFGSFNNLAKLNPELVEIWAQILNRVPGSRLMLKNKGFGDFQTRKYYIILFKKYGISDDRLILQGTVNGVAAHLASYNDIDIALDTYPYHGTTTTFEALWMGVPVVTLAGQAHISRVGVSILTNLGRTAWIAENFAGYVNTAVQLATDPETLFQIRAVLRGQLLDSHLVDGVGFTRNFEHIIEQLWTKYCATGKPQPREEINCYVPE